MIPFMKKYQPIAPANHWLKVKIRCCDGFMFLAFFFEETRLWILFWRVAMDSGGISPLVLGGSEENGYGICIYIYVYIYILEGQLLGSISPPTLFPALRTTLADRWSNSGPRAAFIAAFAILCSQDTVQVLNTFAPCTFV